MVYTDVAHAELAVGGRSLWQKGRYKKAGAHRTPPPAPTMTSSFMFTQFEMNETLYRKNHT
jgi:hypothetical protein